MAETDHSSRAWLERYRARVRGCLLGGALGDALGAPVEFLSTQRIREAYGPDGVTGMLAANGGPAVVTDDTQMTLFTVEGLIRASVRWDRGICHPPSVVYRAYLRWLDTQQRTAPPEHPDGWLATHSWLYARRAPGSACLSGLAAGRMGTPAQPQNPDSKGCGAVMRSAPFGLHPSAAPADVFALAVECATQTHGHPSGYLAAGAFAAIIRGLLDEQSLRAALDGALDLLANHPGHDEVSTALRRAMTLAETPDQRLAPGPHDVERLGAGWVAEEALAIGVYCALVHPDPADLRRALLLAVNHSGDSDSTGAICGNLLGAWHGNTALPPDWLAVLEGRGTILELADDLAAEYTQSSQLHGDYGPHTAWTVRYPGG
jgi:ADP-ribosylglycohydrolase